MCGIVGIVRFDGCPVDTNLLRRQVALLHHRGPDGHAVWVDQNVGLAHARLSIIDRSDAGAQPMLTHDAMHVISYNGELYNTAELCCRLREGHSFRGHSDTEVLLYSLADRGVHAFAQLDGMFAFAWCDRITGRVWLVRDPFGVKPLYVHRNDRRLVFASEIRPLLLDPETPKRPNYAALQRHVLFGYSPDPETAFDGIQRIPPAHAMRVEPDGRCITAAYWSVDELPYTDEGDLWPALQEVARAQLVADVPAGIFLSGGLDSSLLLAAAATSGGLQQDFRAFNVGVEADQAASHPAAAMERQSAAASSAHYGVELVRLDPVHDVASSLSEILTSIEEPIANPANALIDLVCVAARERGTTVLLSGHGGDEIFGGYRRHVWARYLGALRRGGGGGLAWAVERAKRDTLGARMAASLRRDEVHPLVSIAAMGWDLLSDGSISASWFDARAIPSAAAPLEALLARWRGRSYLKQMMLLDLHTYLSAQNLINMDKASMRRSVEVRVPLLSPRVVAAGLRATDRRLVAGRKGKVMLRALAAQHLPPELLRTPKLGFGPTQVALVRSDEVRELLLGWRTLQRGLFDVRRVEARLRALRVGDENAAMQLYGLAAIEQWFRLFMDQSLAEVAA